MAKVEPPAEEGMNRYEPSRRCSGDVFLTTVYAGPHKAKWAKYVFVQCCDEVFDCAEDMDEVIWYMGFKWGSDIKRSRVGEAELWSCSDFQPTGKVRGRRAEPKFEGVSDGVQRTWVKIVECEEGDFDGPIVQGLVI